MREAKQLVASLRLELHYRPCFLAQISRICVLKIYNFDLLLMNPIHRPNHLSSQQPPGSGDGKPQLSFPIASSISSESPQSAKTSDSVSASSSLKGPLPLSALQTPHQSTDIKASANISQQHSSSSHNLAPKTAAMSPNARPGEFSPRPPSTPPPLYGGARLPPTPTQLAHNGLLSKSSSSQSTGSSPLPKTFTSSQQPLNQAGSPTSSQQQSQTGEFAPKRLKVGALVDESMLD